MEPVSLALLAGDPEPRFVEIAKDQPEYQTLPALVYTDGTVLVEYTLSSAERDLIARGENIRVWIRTGRQPLQPIAVCVTSEETP
jgi:hypothetical protein